MTPESLGMRLAICWSGHERLTFESLHLAPDAQVQAELLHQLHIVTSIVHRQVLRRRGGREGREEGGREGGRRGREGEEGGRGGRGGRGAMLRWLLSFWGGDKLRSLVAMTRCH